MQSVLDVERMKHISVKYRYLQDAFTNQEVWLRTVGTKHNVVEGLTKAVNQQVLLATLKIELLESTCKNVSINLIVAIRIQNELVGKEKSTRGVNRSAGHKNIVRDCREMLRNIVRDCREILRNIVRDCRENLRNIVGTFVRSCKNNNIVVTDAMTTVDNNEMGIVINFSSKSQVSLTSKKM